MMLKMTQLVIRKQSQLSIMINLKQKNLTRIIIFVVFTIWIRTNFALISLLVIRMMSLVLTYKLEKLKILN